MGIISDAFDRVYRDHATAGVASSGLHDPTKSDIRTLGLMIDQTVGGALAGIRYYATGAQRAADTSQQTGTLGKAADERDFYRWNGAGWVIDNSIYDSLVDVVAARIAVLAAQVFVKSDARENLIAGPAAGTALTDGEDNAIVGYQAGNQLRAGSRNALFGHSAGYSLTDGTDNLVMGSLAGFNLTTGSTSVFAGAEAGYFATTARYIVAVGVQAGRGITTQVNSVAVGFQALRTGGDSNSTAVGASALYYAEAGSIGNTAVGFQALQETRGGRENTAVGNQALIHNLGDFNSGFGERALDGNRSGTYNTGAGGETGYIQASGSFNTFIGGKAGRGVETNITPTAVSGNGSVVTFTFAARPAAIIAGTTFQATGLGAYDGWYVATGGTTTTVTAAGTTTGAQSATGNSRLNVKFDVSENTIVGFGAFARPLTGADGNTIFGTRAGAAISTGKRNIVIGRDAQADSPTDNDQINVGRRYFHDRIRLLKRASDPAEPTEGNMVVWLSDGTGKADDGDVCIASRANGVTRWAVLFDHSAGQAW